MQDITPFDMTTAPEDRKTSSDDSLKHGDLIGKPLTTGLPRNSTRLRSGSLPVLA